ncbi:hypothetical protein ACXWTF_12735 [Thiomicrolovo sp. ZZH C-3]
MALSEEHQKMLDEVNVEMGRVRDVHATRHIIFFNGDYFYGALTDVIPEELIFEVKLSSGYINKPRSGLSMGRTMLATVEAAIVDIPHAMRYTLPRSLAWSDEAFLLRYFGKVCVRSEDICFIRPYEKGYLEGYLFGPPVDAHNHLTKSSQSPGDEKVASDDILKVDLNQPPQFPIA